MDRERNPAWETTPEDIIVVKPGGRPRQLPPSEEIVLVGSPQRQPQPQHLLLDDDQLPPEERYYKTRLCRKFDVSGRCMYGGLCTFAHGSAELRAPTLQEACFHFRSTGACHYGENCAFSHASAEPGLAIRNLEEPKLVEARRSEAPSARNEIPAAPRRAFFLPMPAPAVRERPRQMSEGQEGTAGAKISNLERLSRKKTSGIYGDWPF